MVQVDAAEESTKMDYEPEERIHDGNTGSGVFAGSVRGNNEGGMRSVAVKIGEGRHVANCLRNEMEMQRKVDGSDHVVRCLAHREGRSDIGTERFFLATERMDMTLAHFVGIMLE